MYRHNFDVDIKFSGEMRDIPDEVSVQEVKFLITNLIVGLFFQENDGESVVPFDPATLEINVKPAIQIMKEA